MSVARLRYPMMSVKKDNYEAILTACYLHDKYENEKLGTIIDVITVNGQNVQT